MKNKKLKAYRILKGLTQEELARKIGTYQKAISLYELGKKIPRRKRQEEIAQVLGKKRITTIFPTPKRKKRKKRAGVKPLT